MRGERQHPHAIHYGVVPTMTAADMGGRATEHTALLAPIDAQDNHSSPSTSLYLAPPVRAPEHSSAGDTLAVRGFDA